MKQQMHELLILNQSVIDLLSAILLILLTATVKSTAGWDMSSVFGHIMCFTWYNSMPLWSLFFVSTVNLVLLTIERYLEVSVMGDDGGVSGHGDEGFGRGML